MRAVWPWSSATRQSRQSAQRRWPNSSTTHPSQSGRPQRPHVAVASTAGWLMQAAPIGSAPRAPPVSGRARSFPYLFPTQATASYRGASGIELELELELGSSRTFEFEFEFDAEPDAA